MFGRRGTETSSATPPPPRPPATPPARRETPAAATQEKPTTETSQQAAAPVDTATPVENNTPSAPAPAPAAAPASPGKKSKMDLLNEQSGEQPEAPSAPAAKPGTKSRADSDKELQVTKEKIYGILMEQIDIATSSKMPREELKRQIIELIGEIVIEQKLMLSGAEQQYLAGQIVDDMLGFGPLEVLLRDDAVSDIMVNGPYQIYVERKGKLTLTDIKFRDNAHVMAVATRIVTAIGRRVDESTPICDARLPDGSRVNVIAQPCSIKGASISIRKFSEKKITLEVMTNSNSLSTPMCKALKIFGAIRLNTIVSGGTGSGKTTMLNALSRMIDHGERVVTIEDAAELQLQQPHVVPLETRPANLEGTGEITMRDLVKNSLRMRPDRIILGEVRGGEAFDLLQAMNTGHDGSMGTLHSNNPREALTRMENMINMAGVNLPSRAIRTQIAGAVNLIVQVQRMRDGTRRTTHITEVVGMEGDVIVTQDLFTFEFVGEDDDGKLIGKFKSSKIRPKCLPQAAYFGLDQALLEAMMAEDE